MIMRLVYHNNESECKWHFWFQQLVVFPIDLFGYFNVAITRYATSPPQVADALDALGPHRVGNPQVAWMLRWKLWRSIWKLFKIHWDLLFVFFGCIKIEEFNRYWWLSLFRKTIDNDCQWLSLSMPGGRTLSTCFEDRNDSKSHLKIGTTALLSSRVQLLCKILK